MLLKDRGIDAHGMCCCGYSGQDDQHQESIFVRPSALTDSAFVGIYNFSRSSNDDDVGQSESTRPHDTDEFEEGFRLMGPSQSRPASKKLGIFAKPADHHYSDTCDMDSDGG